MLSNMWSFVRTFGKRKRGYESFSSSMTFFSTLYDSYSLITKPITHFYLLSSTPYLSLNSVLPCPQGPPVVGVWQVRCACPSVHKTQGWSCSCGPGSPRLLSAAVQRHDGSFCRDTMSCPPAPPAPGRPVNALEEGSSYPWTLPCEDQTPGTGPVPGPADGTENVSHPQRALV